MLNVRISELKARAWQDLSGRWGNAVWVTLLVGLISLGAAFVPLGSLLIGGPLSIGLVVYFVNMAKKMEVQTGLIFTPFNKYGNALLTYFLRMILILLATSPIIIYVAIYFIIHSADIESLSVAQGIGLTLTLLVLLIIPIYVELRLALMYYIVSDNMEVPADKALELSWKMMSGHVWDLFVLTLSFILWYFLGILTFGIAFLWLMPYYTTTVAHFYLELKNLYPEYAEIIDGYGKPDKPIEPMDTAYVNE